MTLQFHPRKRSKMIFTRIQHKISRQLVYNDKGVIHHVVILLVFLIVFSLLRRRFIAISTSESIGCCTDSPAFSPAWVTKPLYFSLQPKVGPKEQRSFECFHDVIFPNPCFQVKSATLVMNHYRLYSYHV